MSLAEEVEHPLVGGPAAVGGDGDQVRVPGRVETIGDQQVDSEARADGAGIGSGDPEVEGGTSVGAAVDPEHLADDPELERREAGQGEEGDGAEHGGRISPPVVIRPIHAVDPRR